MVGRERLLDLVDALGDARVTLVGDLVLDRFILGTPKRISREAPVIILRHEGQEDIPGGGANALANLRALDVHVTPVGAVGDDEPGTALIGVLRDRGIPTDRILRVPGYRTPTKVRILGGGATSLKHQVARYDIEDELPADGAWRDVLRRHLAEAGRDCGAVAMSDYGYGAADPSLASAADTRWTCVDSRYRVGDFRGVHAVTPNLEELEAWAGRELADDAAVTDAAQALREHLGARFVLATRGNRGMTLATGDATVHLPVHGTDQVADVTGAGDTVLATLIAALAAGATPLEAAALANIAGGLVVMKLGTATIARDELRHAIAGAESAS
jgi:rfaE bifunctional protein kinase chain/domain